MITRPALKHAPYIKQAHPRRMSAGFTATGLALYAVQQLQGCIFFLYLPTDLRAHVVVSGMPSTCKGYSGTKFKFST
eukprot:SAG11_NODE_6548_length_1290_cov_2.379513_2_plen_76_part_01